METIRRKTTTWWPAWIAAARYVLLIQLGAVSTWLETVTPRWYELTTLDWTKFGVGQAVLFLGTMGAIMNDKWSKARANDNTQTTSNIK